MRLFWLTLSICPAYSNLFYKIQDPSLALGGISFWTPFYKHQNNSKQKKNRSDVTIEKINLQKFILPNPLHVSNRVNLFLVYLKLWNLNTKIVPTFKKFHPFFEFSDRKQAAEVDQIITKLQTQIEKLEKKVFEGGSVSFPMEPEISWTYLLHPKTSISCLMRSQIKMSWMKEGIDSK